MIFAGVLCQPIDLTALSIEPDSLTGLNTYLARGGIRVSSAVIFRAGMLFGAAAERHERPFYLR